ncbi:hypothetical protein PAL_GLEAN10021316 [Pteropus alecto]|uniref:Uncharacterized protein n=1 Tax=Pteropus alecto TaxID=9402 RepID=L5KUW3_PTEAL|nr:hypothetical protein PAL_GLEAN10021316 [Pteropus alecto]
MQMKLTAVYHAPVGNVVLSNCETERLQLRISANTINSDSSSYNSVTTLMGSLTTQNTNINKMNFRTQRDQNSFVCFTYSFPTSILTRQFQLEKKALILEP